MAIVPCALMLRVNVFPVNGGFLRRRHGNPEGGTSGAALCNGCSLVPIHCAESVLFRVNSLSLCKAPTVL